MPSATELRFGKEAWRTLTREVRRPACNDRLSGCRAGGPDGASRETMEFGLCGNLMTASFDIFCHHGGRLEEAMKAFPAAPQPWLDLSTGINPHPWPVQPVDTVAWRRLPEPADISWLEKKASEFFGCHSDFIAAVSGAETALRLLPFALKAQTVAIVSPTYGSHEASWFNAGVDIRPIAADKTASERSDVLVVVNPNNPDGHIFERQFLLDLGKARANDGLWTVIDESFIDPTPELSIADELPNRTIVLRSFGKFFGLPGLRLGFAIAHPDIVSRLRHLTGDWPLNQQALATGIGAYGDIGWQRRMRDRLREDMPQLEDMLASAGFARIGGTSLFTLQQSPIAGQWFKALAGKGVLTRPFAADPHRLRFGLPDEAGLERLEAALHSGPAIEAGS